MRVMLGSLEGLRLRGRGVRSQNVSGTKKNKRTKQKPTTIATIL